MSDLGGGVMATMLRALIKKLQTSSTAPNPYNMASGVGQNLQANRLARNQPYMKGGALVDSSGEWLPLNKQNFDNGDLSLASSSIIKQGSNSTYVIQGVFGTSHVVVGAACTTTLYWDGTNSSQVFVIRRSDGTAETVPPGSITVSGLLASTTYYLLPYWTPSNICTLGWVPGTVGSPQIIFSANTDKIAISLQTYQSREPLTNGYGSFVTPAASGGGGGFLPCVMLGTEIEGIEDCEFSGEHLPETEWWRIEANGASVNVVPKHRFYDPMGNPKEARDFRVGDWIVRREGDFQVTASFPFARVCTKVRVKMRRVHLFWANGFLSHNMKALD